MCDLVIVGAGGHAKSVLDCAVECDLDCVVVDTGEPNVGGILLGHGVHYCALADIPAMCVELGSKAIVAIGDNRTRRDVFSYLFTSGVMLATIAHPSAVVSRYADIRCGTVLMAGSVVNAGAKIGNNVILNTSCSVDHDCVVMDHVHISPGARLAGAVHVETGTQIGIGATVRQCVNVGSWSVVGAGAVVVADIPDSTVSFGVPAKYRWSTQ